LVGAFVTRFRPRGLSHVLIVVALAQALVPAIALTIWPQVRSLSDLRVGGFWIVGWGGLL